jgi:hypothetical protein
MGQVLRLHLSLDFDEVGKDGSGAREKFEETLCMDLAHSSNLTAENFLVLAMARGSVMVDVEILHHHHIDGDWSPCDVLQDLLLQAKTSSSKLLQGTLTRHTDSLTAITKSTDFTEDWVQFDQTVVSPFSQSVNQQQGTEIDNSVGMADCQKAASHKPAQESPTSPSKPGGLAYTLSDTLHLDFGNLNAGEEERTDTRGHDSESLSHTGHLARPAVVVSAEAAAAAAPAPVPAGADEEPNPVRQRPADPTQLAAAKRLISVVLLSCFRVFPYVHLRHA